MFYPFGMPMPGRVYPTPAPPPASLTMPGGSLSGYNSSTSLFTNVADNFTVELWVKPTSTHQIDAQSTSGFGGVSGQKFVIDPYHGGSNAGVGISVGTNGVSVYEHGDNYMPAPLVWQGTLSDWTHVAVVYQNKQPKLYINGVLVKTGLTSPRAHVYPGSLVGSGSYGTMTGQVDEVRIWKTVRTQTQLKDNMKKPVEAPQTDLEAYWSIEPNETTSLVDRSGNNHSITLPTASYTNTPVSAPVTQYNYRYGFNGKENDNEVKGTGNQQDYGMRIYDPRLGRFLSVDPLYKSYPELSTYQYASNSPIENIDLDGLEKYSFHLRTVNGTEQIVKVETDNSLKYKCTPLIASIPTTKPKVAEFIYEDEKGNVISKTAEIPLKNFGSTIYVGPWNPKKEDGKTDDYKLPAINSLDAAAKKHDLAYDKVQAVGFKGALLDLETLPADKQLVKDASLVVAMYYLNITDPVNNQPISEETKDAAVKVVGIFTATVGEKTARIAANSASNYVEKKAESLWDRFTSGLNEAIKETERKLTPQLHQ